MFHNRIAFEGQLDVDSFLWCHFHHWVFGLRFPVPFGEFGWIPCLGQCTVKVFSLLKIESRVRTFLVLSRRGRTNVRLYREKFLLCRYWWAGPFLWCTERVTVTSPFRFIVTSKGWCSLSLFFHRKVYICMFFVQRFPKGKYLLVIFTYNKRIIFDRFERSINSGVTFCSCYVAKFIANDIDGWIIFAYVLQFRSFTDLICEISQLYVNISIQSKICNRRQQWPYWCGVWDNFIGVEMYDVVSWQQRVCSSSSPMNELLWRKQRLLILSQLLQMFSGPFVVERYHFLLFCWFGQL